MERGYHARQAGWSHAGCFCGTGRNRTATHPDYYPVHFHLCCCPINQAPKGLIAFSEDEEFSFLNIELKIPRCYEKIL